MHGDARVLVKRQRHLGGTVFAKPIKHDSSPRFARHVLIVVQAVPAFESGCGFKPKEFSYMKIAESGRAIRVSALRHHWAPPIFACDSIVFLFGKSQLKNGLIVGESDQDGNAKAG